MRNKIIIFSSLCAMLMLVGAGCQPSTRALSNINEVVATASAKSPTEIKVPYYSTADVAQHATPEDCWVIIGNSAYDITKYLPRHQKPLEQYCGKDASAAFANGPHNEKSSAKLTPMLVGDMEP